ncbi:MAG: polysaccharide biosynthesis protein [Desulfobulbus sp.]|jgi:FlaA1/EpsC-like NDP-sugar epimerase
MRQSPSHFFQLQRKLLWNQARNPKFWMVLGMDALLVLLAHFLAYAIRFDLALSDELLQQCTSLFPLLLLIKMPILYLFGAYRGIWRYTSLADLFNIFRASLSGTVVLLIFLLFENRFVGFSRSVFILDALLSFLLIISYRVAIRSWYQRFGDSQSTPAGTSPSTSTPKKRLLMIGSGDAAEKVLRELHDTQHLPYEAVGLVTENPKKIGLKLHGVPVIGLVRDLGVHVRQTGAEEILIAVVNASREQMRRFVELCRETRLPYKVLPSMSELIDGKLSIRAIREISYKDLLGREEVRLDMDRIGGYLAGKTVLITGAGGTIGSELCRQLLRFEPGLLLLLDSCEEHLYTIQTELHYEHGAPRAQAILGEVQDVRLLWRIFQDYLPEVVFHAAAYKHVPLVEHNPWQAVLNNILAAQRLIEAAILHRVERFVLVSTDKAVRPTNVMGASKRVTELLMQAYGSHCWDGHFSPAWEAILREQREDGRQWHKQPHSTLFMGVRFGNVLGSSGSVIPLFKRQIERGGPVTVTHPKVVRYFMSAEEAAQLILQSGSMGEGGEIFILRMGEPVRIADMARELIKLTGHTPDEEIEIRYIGLRAGEKLYEELITEGEGIVDTSHEKIMVLRGKEHLSCTLLEAQLDQLTDKARNADSRGIKEMLNRIVPEYTPDYRA